MTTNAEIIPFGGKDKEDHLDTILDEIRSGKYDAAYIFSDDKGRVRFGHSVKTKSDLIILTHTMKRLMEYFIEADDLTILLAGEDEDGEE